MQPVCLFGHFTYFNGSRCPRYRNERRCHVTFTRVRPPIAPFALLSPPLLPRYIDKLSPCLFSVSFINLLYLLLSSFILSLPFCTDPFLFQVLPPSVYFFSILPFIPFFLHSLPSVTNSPSSSSYKLRVCFCNPFLRVQWITVR